MANKRNQGMTILEVLLVLAIGSFIMMMSFRQYQGFKTEADVQQVRANVDLLFQAMTDYFRANCNKAPLNAFASTLYYPVSINDLMTGGYLNLQNNTMPINPLVNADGPGQGYILQFNQLQDPDTASLLPERQVDISTPQQQQLDPTQKHLTPMGNIVMWQAQVSVELKDPDTAETFQPVLGADCLSSAAGGVALAAAPKNPTTSTSSSTTKSVTPCNSAPVTANQYAVFTRLPSFSSSKMNSNFWPSMQKIRQFTQMYTTFPILLLTNGSDTSNQYFVCGGS